MTSGYSRHPLARTIAIYAALVGGSVAVAAGAAEVGLRLKDGVPLTKTSNFVVEQLDLIPPLKHVLHHDPLLGWRLNDNFYVRGSGFTTGESGLRMNTGSITPPAKGAIVAVGDSFTVGSGVRDEETWPAELERLSGRQVLNGAAGAWGVDQAVLRAEQLVEFYAPKVLIVSPLAQDSFRNGFDLYGGGYKPYFLVENGDVALKGVPVPRVAARPIHVGRIRSVLGHSYLTHWIMLKAGFAARWIDNSYRYHRVMSDEDGVKISCLLMNRLKALQAGRDLRIIIAILNGGDDSLKDTAPWYGEAVIKCAAASGFETLDTYPLLHAVADADRDRFLSLWQMEGGQFGHLSPAGNRFIAEQIYAAFFASGNGANPGTESARP